MIYFFYETDFKLNNSEGYKDWLVHCANNYNKTIGEINYIFCDDEYLLEINKKYLNHDDLTDIISFDDSDEEILNGDIFISIPRVNENANIYNTLFYSEVARVLIHGILHFSGFKDKTKNEQLEMTTEEDNCLSILEQYVPRETL